MSEGSYVVVNPASGGGRAGRLWPELAGHLRQYDEQLQVGLTESPGQATALVREALKRGHTHILSVGGDGTHNEVANGFFEDGAPLNPQAQLSVLPCGTGGDLRRTLNLPDDPLQAAAYVGLDPQPVDVGCAEFLDHTGAPTRRYFLNIASFGLSGEVVKYVNRSGKKLGATPTFLLSVAQASLRYSPPEVALFYEDESGQIIERHQQRILNVVLANARYFGGGMRVAPRADMADGLFDVVVIGALSRLQQSLHMAKMYRGEIEHIPHTHQRRSALVRAEALGDAPVLLDIDGEQPGRLPARFTLERAALRLCRGPHD